ncbi:MAG: radical SAM protein, partial [Promethearchaeota archaeon]
VETISMQTNGLLLNQDVITQLESTNLTRINISLNTLSQKKATYLSNCPDFNIKDLQKNIELLLLSKINVLLAPVWFPGENDEDIEDLIIYTLDLRKRGYSEEKIQIGIQKYLIYKTGRKLKKIRPKSWDYFYKQLTKLEKKHKIKLKLGPNDFNIHKRRKYPIQRFTKNEIHRLTVVSKGRWDNEYIGKINDNSGIKILVDKNLVHSENLVGSEIEVKIIKANYKNNLLTAVFPK